MSNAQEQKDDEKFADSLASSVHQENSELMSKSRIEDEFDSDIWPESSETEEDQQAPGSDEEVIRIALIDDHTLFRSGLKALLSRQQDFRIVGEAADGLEGVKLVEKVKPDLVLLDLDMPMMTGIEALAQILGTDPDMNVLMLTVSEDGDDLTECMRLGARGYLLKKIDADFLLQSIRHAVAGDSVISPEMTSKLVLKLRRENYPGPATVMTPAPDVESLTPRERQTLAWLSRGVSNKEIARAMDLAESTVKVHVQSVLRKLNIKSRVQAAVFAVEHHLDKL